MDVLEERLFEGHAKVEAQEIFLCRRQATALSHVVRPMRDLTVRLQRIESPFLTKTTEPFFRDLADHGGHLAAASESLRESSISLRDFHSTALSNQLNEVMRFLASFSALFLPLTFLAGIYGMNFEMMPELRQPWAYPALWGIFLLIGVGMFVLFRKKRWI
ncbi:MAG: magnesium transporter [Verrucomicrobiales bacterium]|jgi:magnesium transporter